MMLACNRLLIEYDGLKDSVQTYDDNRMNNIVEQLKRGFFDCDLQTVYYCLQQLHKWLSDIIDDYEQSSSVYYNEITNLNTYREIVLNAMHEIEEGKISLSKKSENKKPVDGKPIVFLSHSSSDKKYGNALRNFMVNLGVPEGSIIYTSHPLHKIPLDKNIYEYLRENISGNVFVIILWSNSYLNSPACLNEMGAAWVAQSDYTNIYVPDFDFGNPKYHECAVDTRKMGAVLNGNQHCKASMIEFKNKIQNLFHLKNDEAKTQYLLDCFIKEITEDENG